MMVHAGGPCATRLLPPQPSGRSRHLVPGGRDSDPPTYSSSGTTHPDRSGHLCRSHHVRKSSDRRVVHDVAGRLECERRRQRQIRRAHSFCVRPRPACGANSSLLNTPSDAARDVLQARDVQVLAIHARHAVRQHHDPVVEVEGGVKDVLSTQVLVLMPMKQTVRTPRLLRRISRSVPMKQSRRFLVVDDVVGFVVEFRNDIAAGEPSTLCSLIVLLRPGVRRSWSSRILWSALPERNDARLAAGHRAAFASPA